MIAAIGFLGAAALGAGIIPFVTLCLKQAGLNWTRTVAAALITYCLYLLVISDLL